MTKMKSIDENWYPDDQREASWQRKTKKKAVSPKKTATIDDIMVEIKTQLDDLLLCNKKEINATLEAEHKVSVSLKLVLSEEIAGVFDVDTTLNFVRLKISDNRSGVVGAAIQKDLFNDSGDKIYDDNTD